MKNTITYYNNNAKQYYEATIGADFRNMRDKFCSLLPEHARIIDIGCGSGRDVKAFCDMGYQAVGLDASEKLAQLARSELGIEVITADMTSWKGEKPYDGIWCCAALLHLHEKEARTFLQNLQYNLKDNGILFLSVKEGVETGFDDKNRYMRNYSEAELRELIGNAGLNVLELSRTKDKLGREDFAWLNVFAKKE